MSDRTDSDAGGRRPFAASLLRRLGIDGRMYGALMNAYLLMDFRSQQFGRATKSGPRALVAPLFWVVGQYLLLSIIASALLYGRVDAYFFALLNLGVSMFVIVTAAIVEFNEIVLDPQDFNVIGHRPIPPRTYTAARVANLLCYMLLMTAALNVAPAIVGIGLLDAGWTFLPAYAMMALLGNAIVMGLVILVYSEIMRGRPSEPARDILAWTQIILILVFFYGAQLILRDPLDRLEMIAYNLPDWVAWLPLAWMARFVDSCSPTSAGVQWWILGVALLATGGVWGLVLWSLSKAYARIEPGRSAWHSVDLPPLPAPGRLLGPVCDRLLRRKDERVGFWLCWTMLARDHDLKMRSWPQLAVVAAAIALGLFSNQLGDPWEVSGGAGILSVGCIYLLAYPVPVIMGNLRYSRHHQGAWTLEAAPIHDPAAFGEGLRKAVAWRIFLPVILGLFVFFAWSWGHPLRALIHCACGWLAVTGAGYAARIGVLRGLPFSRPLARGETLGTLSIFASMVAGAALLLAAFHYHFVKSTPWFCAYVTVLLGVVLALRHVAARVGASGAAETENRAERPAP